MKIKYLLIGVLIGAILLPTITLGGSFISSLIAGKTPEEAIQIIGNQIDSLTGRIEIVESEQIEIKQSISTSETENEKLKQCKNWNEYIIAKEKIDYYIANRLISSDLSIINPLANGSPNRLDQKKYNQTIADYQQYLNLLSVCSSL